MRITKRSVDNLSCAADGKRKILWDDAISGFGIVAFPSGAKSYVVQYRFRGRSRRFTIGPHGPITPDAARSRALEILAGVRSDKEPIAQRRAEREAERSACTFGEMADEFMRFHAERKCKPSTVREYKSLLDQHLYRALGRKRAGEITRADAVRLHTALAATPFRANRCLSMISAVWNWAADRDQVSALDNPTTRIQRYKEHRRERFLSTDELVRLGAALRDAETIGLPWNTSRLGKKLKHMPKERQRRTLDPYAVAAIRLLILTGARLNEILTAKWEHVDFERALLLLPDSKTGMRPIYLNAPALAVFASLERRAPNPFVFPGATDGTRRADLGRPWRAIATAASLEGVRIHDLRHSFASVGVGASLGLPIVGKLLGHTQASTTQRYSHLETSPIHHAANVIGSRIAAALDGETASIMRLRQS